MPAPTVANTTPDERRAYIRKAHPCIADCDACGFCKSFKLRDPEAVFAPYIAGQMEYAQAAMLNRR